MTMGSYGKNEEGDEMEEFIVCWGGFEWCEAGIASNNTKDSKST